MTNLNEHEKPTVLRLRWRRHCPDSGPTLSGRVSAGPKKSPHIHTKTRTPTNKPTTISRRGNKMGNSRGAAAAGKPTRHDRVSMVMYVTLNPPWEGDVDADLKIPRASYGSRRSRVTRRRVKKLNQPRVDRTTDTIHPAFSRTRTDFPKPPLPIVILVLNLGSLREYCVADAANALCARDTNVAGHQKHSLLFRESFCSMAQMKIRRKSGWFGGIGLGSRPNNVRSGFESVSGPFPTLTIFQSVQANASCITAR